MSEVKQQGRRRATTPVLAELGPAHGSRRAALAAERSNDAPYRAFGHLARASKANGTGQKVGLVLAATGLVLAVTVPSATGGSPINAGLESALTTNGAVSAAADIPISFEAPTVRSVLNPDGRLQEVLQVKASNVTAQAAKGTLSAPMAQMTESSPFGARINPMTGAMGDFHEGLDIAAQCSTDVFAAAGGTVSYAQWHEFGGGNRIVINHGNGLSTTYNHLNSIGVKVGQKVERGEQIALSGTTGNSTGCHLHFEVIVDDEKVDPEGWL